MPAGRGFQWNRGTTLIKEIRLKLKGCMKNLWRGRNRLRSLWPGVIAMLLAGTAVARAQSGPPVKRIAEIADELRQQLGIPQRVEVQIVASDSLAFSVQPTAQHRQFAISVDSSFLRQLNDEELKAAVAHELGHVWIYTHHPFLHTEALANEIALRVVSKDALSNLYNKLQHFEAARGDHSDGI